MSGRSRTPASVDVVVGSVLRTTRRPRIRFQPRQRGDGAREPYLDLVVAEPCERPGHKRNYRRWTRRRLTTPMAEIAATVTAPIVAIAAGAICSITGWPT